MELSKKKYQIIYADPPWKYENFSDSSHGAVASQYPTMSMDELFALQIQELASDDCVLFMWATFPKLKESLLLMEKWGFEYRTVAFTWVKLNKSGIGFFSGIGFHTASNVEIVLLGKRGSLQRKDKSVKQVITSRLRKHSQKPLETYSRIEKLYGDVPRIELFSRHRREGWDCWGNEVPKECQKLLNKLIA